MITVSNLSFHSSPMLLISALIISMVDFKILDILTEQRQGIRVEVKPGDGPGPHHHTADGEDTTAAAEVSHMFVLEVVEGCGDGVEHTGSNVGSRGIRVISSALQIRPLVVNVARVASISSWEPCLIVTLLVWVGGS